MPGLSSAEVAQRVARGQTNAVKATTSRPLWHIVRDNVFTLFNAILTVCFVLVLLFGDLRDGLFFGVVVANALIGVVQEVRAKLALDRLALLASPVVAVLRDDELRTIAPDEVVLGDLVVLRAGDQIVADGVVADSIDLTINESLLTGESEPVEKQPGDRVLSGSLVASGGGRITVTAVGASSYASRLTAEIRRHSLAQSELRRATNRILVYISWVIGPVALLVIGSRILSYGQGLDLGVLSPQEWRGLAVDVVASLVGMIPEGLVLLTSLAFGVAAIRLAAQKVLIQELAAVEVLARVDVLCLDKTGTLTSGTVRFHSAQTLRNDPAMDAALSLFARDEGANATAKALADAYPQVGATAIARIPFASKRQCSGVELELNGQRSAWLLGAPERVFAQFPEYRERAAAEQAAGHRALGLVRLHGALPSPERLDPETIACEPTAILILGEQIRPDAAQTLQFFRDQGVRCVIISGDNPTTVAALAKGLGVGTSSVDAGTLDGDDALRAALAEHSIFGRVTPDQKRAMVHVLQRDGRTVAMTGDGVNDAMAIKDADLGIAMGSGTSAAKAVARLVLLDDQFVRLPSVLGYGRQVIANVERVANLFLSKTVYGILFAIVFALLLWPFPFLPRQLTLVSSLTIGIPAFFLALSPNQRIYHPGILRRLLQYAAPTGAIAALVTFACHAILRGVAGADQTRAVTTITLWLVAFWILCVLARPFDRWRALLLTATAAAFVFVLVVPVGRDFFAMPVVWDATVLIGVGFGILGAIGIELMYRFARARGLIYDRQ